MTPPATLATDYQQTTTADALMMFSFLLDIARWGGLWLVTRLSRELERELGEVGISLSLALSRERERR